MRVVSFVSSFVVYDYLITCTVLLHYCTTLWTDFHKKTQAKDRIEIKEESLPRLSAMLCVLVRCPPRSEV